MRMMKIVFTLFVLLCCLAMGNATIKLKLLKSKLKTSASVYPVVKYTTVKYHLSPVVAPEPLPATYARPVSIAHASTYSISSPSVVTYRIPIDKYTAPYSYASTYRVPLTVHSRPITTAYGATPIVHYSEPEPVYFEPLPYGAPITEELFSIYDKHLEQLEH